MKYRIVPKRDFGPGPGFLIKGQFVKRGFVVTDGHCNVMPGATWFQSIAESFRAIAILDASGGDSETFWSMMRRQS